MLGAFDAAEREGLERHRCGQVVDRDDFVAGLRRVFGQFLDGRDVPHMLIAVGHHRAAPVPPAVADNDHFARQERVGGAHHRADVQVVPPVLDRNGELVPSRVQVGDDRLDAPVSVAVDDVAPVAVA